MLAILLLLLLASLPCFADSPAAALLTQADAAYAQRTDLAESKMAMVYYEHAIQADPGSVELYWKAARNDWWLGDHAENRGDKLTYFQKGIALAQEGIQKNPNSVESHFWLGAIYGSYGEAKGILKSLSLVKPIRQEMATVIRLNDHYLGGGGYRVLGVVDYKVPGIAGGSKKRALEELNRALAIDPNDSFTHYYLAEYFKWTGDKDKVRAELKTLQTLNVPAESQPELLMLQQRGVKLSEGL